MEQEIDESKCEHSTKKGSRSFFKLEVFCLHPYNEMLDAPEPEDKKDIPYQGTDSIRVKLAYSVYVLDNSAVMKAIQAAVKIQERLYCIRVYNYPLDLPIYNLPLNVSIECGECLDVTVFFSKGEKMEKSTDIRFNPNEIIEYYDSEEENIKLAVVYKILYHNEHENDNGNIWGYSVLTQEHGLMPLYVHPWDVSVPSFPVSEALRKELESLYKQYLETVKDARIAYSKLMDILSCRKF